MSAEKHCQDLWKECVRWRDRHCQICGYSPAPDVIYLLHAHHIYFRSQENWKIQFDTDFGVGLGKRCHLEKRYAPHQDNKIFLSMILSRIQQDEPERAAKIINFLNNPIDIIREKPDYAEIAARLQLELRSHKENYWMNQDCDRSRGASI